MALRKRLLRAMLWSLGLAATAGVAAALFTASEVLWRVVGTGVVTALACAVMLPFSTRLDSAETRGTGLGGMAVVVLEFLLALATIWEVPEHLLGVQWNDELGLTMLFVPLAAGLVAIFRRLAKTLHGRPAADVGLWATALTFAGFMVATWIPAPYVVPDHWWESGGAVFQLGILALLSLVGAGGSPRRSWRWLSPPAAAVAFALWMSKVWLGTESALGTVAFAGLVSVAAVAGHANLALLVNLAGRQRWVRLAAIAAAGATAVLAVLMVVKEEYPAVTWSTQRLGRVTAAVGIAAACATLALLVLARLGRPQAVRLPAAELRELTVTCPRCHKRQTIAVGEAACPGCGLRIAIRVAEPG